MALLACWRGVVLAWTKRRAAIKSSSSGACPARLGASLEFFVVLMALENWLLYHPTRSTRCWQEPPPALRVEDVELTTRDGVRIHAWWTAPEGWAPSDGAMLYCHGNAGNVSARGEHLAVWQHGWTRPC